MPTVVRRERDLTKAREASYSKSREREASLAFTNIFNKEEPMAELQLDPQKTALVLIDLQNAVLGMTPAPHSADKVVENSVKLIP